MGFRFRKSIKIAKGVRLNAGKRGLSLTAGGRGGKITFGSSGTTVTGGIPGTGISYSQKVGKSPAPQNNSASIPQNINASVRILDNGKIELVDSNENPLPPKIKKIALEQNKDSIRDLLDREVQHRNQEINKILNIHLETPPLNQEIVFKRKIFDTPKPTPPIQKEIGFLGKFIGAKREAIHQENEAAQREYDRQVQKWEASRSEFEHSENIRKSLIETGRFSDSETMQEFLEYIFLNIDFPRETLLSFQVESDRKEVMIDIDLPEIEDIPTEQASLSKNGLQLSTKKRSDTQVRKDYMNHIHGIIFRIIGQTFVALPTVETIACSGYSQRPDKATGQINDEYLLSVKVKREEWKNINFDNLQGIDLVACIGSFDIKRKMTKTGIFTAIEPFDS